MLGAHRRCRPRRACIPLTGRSASGSACRRRCGCSARSPVAAPRRPVRVCRRRSSAAIANATSKAKEAAAERPAGRDAAPAPVPRRPRGDGAARVRCARPLTGAPTELWREVGRRAAARRRALRARRVDRLGRPSPSATSPRSGHRRAGRRRSGHAGDIVLVSQLALQLRGDVAQTDERGPQAGPRCAPPTGSSGSTDPRPRSRRCGGATTAPPDATRGRHHARRRHVHVPGHRAAGPARRRRAAAGRDDRRHRRRQRRGEDDAGEAARCGFYQPDDRAHHGRRNRPRRARHRGVARRASAGASRTSSVSRRRRARPSAWATSRTGR